MVIFAIVMLCANRPAQPVIDRELSRNYTQTWSAMEKLVEKGKTKLIGLTEAIAACRNNSLLCTGLSNFNILKTKNILHNAKIRPSVNQVELHP